MNNNHQAEVWDKGFIVTMATVKSVVDQYAQGTIQLEIPQGKGRHNIRYVADKPYTASTVAKFLGWLQPDGKASLKVFTAISALQLVEEGKIDVSTFAGVTENEAYTILADLKRQGLNSDDSSQQEAFCKRPASEVCSYCNTFKDHGFYRPGYCSQTCFHLAMLQRKKQGEQHATTSNNKDGILLSMEDAKKIHHTLISLAQSALELAKLVKV